MVEFLRKLSNVGIKTDMQAVDIKILGLMNRVVLLSMGVFLIMTVVNLLDGNPEPTYLSAFNFFGFGSMIYIHYRGFYPKSKHFFAVYGLAMVTIVNLTMPAVVMPQFNYVTGVVFTMLVFRDKKTANFYVLMFFLSYLFTLWYRAYFPSYFVIDDEDILVSIAVGPIINIFVVSYGSLLFFKRLNREYESTLLTNNRLLERQKHEIELQASMLNKKNELLNKTNEELKITLEQIKEMQEHMLQQEKMASLGQLTAGIAHEINNPVNFVSANVSPLKKDISELQELVEKLIEEQRAVGREGSLENLLNRYEYTYLINEIKELLGGMEEGANRTKKIVAGLRSFSRNNQDDRKLFNINSAIKVTLDLLSHRTKNGVQIMTDYCEQAEILCNPDQINQVLMNIISNAIDAIEEKGKLEVTTYFTKNSQDIVIKIQDDGKGMSEEVKRKIFDPFYTTKSIGKGTGLGLSISYGIIKDHKGSISVQSEIGMGTTFLIRLPRV